ncbi:hypothetical protein OHC51_12945 [Stenotrophomonas indicatrix]|uniref:hypothetical protein n=1 Tax=Stenotrophomonas indicatrix TaxID=2045451 RepID=UPI00300A42D4
MLTRIAAGLLLSAVVGSVAAQQQIYQQQIYKCVTKAGTEYQSMPCAGGAPSKTWNVEVAPRSDAVVANEQRIDAMRQQNAAALQPPPPQQVYRRNSGGGQLHHISQYRDGQRCENAKAERDRVYRQVGLHRTFMLSRRMDDMVYEACK